MDMRHLRYFVAVADAGHMTRAAAQLGMQQPPLSLQIKALEKELGMALFHRHPKGVSLSDSGRVFLVEARRLLDDMAAMQLRMRRLAQGRQGSLAVGFTSSAAAHAFTPQALRECRSRFPDIELQLSEDSAAGITDAVASARLHCGLLRVPVGRPKGVALETLLDEPVVAALPLDHALARRGGKQDTITLEDLQDERLILVRRPGAPGLYANLLALCEARGVTPVVVAEVERMMTNLNLVAAGAGISVVPASMQGAHPHAIVYRPLHRDVQLGAPLTLAFRSADCAGITATFVELLRAVSAPWRQPVRRGRGAAA
jgi:DNA-binding transcriptional LysR family regulator